MPKVNWRVRIQHPAFWVALFGLIGLIVTDAGWLDAGRYETYAQAVMLVLIAGGIVADQTTEGFSDSNRALTYSKPAPNAKVPKFKKG